MLGLSGKKRAKRIADMNSWVCEKTSTASATSNPNYQIDFILNLYFLKSLKWTPIAPSDGTDAFTTAHPKCSSRRPASPQRRTSGMMDGLMCIFSTLCQEILGQIAHETLPIEKDM